MDMVLNRFKEEGGQTDLLAHFTQGVMERSAKFHQSVPEYAATPLVHLDDLSQQLGVANIYAKDESERFGLNAFKGLGGIYVMAEYFRRYEGLDFNDYNELLKMLKTHPGVTFATATDGNHGKGVAWAASLLGQKAKVFMPEGAAEHRLEAVRQLGAEATATTLNYDDTVKETANLAKEHGWVLLQDTAWPGYDEIPLMIMEGYTTLMSEVHAQLGDTSFNDITHVFLQAGVGSFVVAMTAAVLSKMDGNRPRIIVVEAGAADCFHQSMKDTSGKSQQVTGSLNTVMAGLACGAPSTQGFEMLKASADAFIRCGDGTSEHGMRLYGRPTGSDEPVVSGASGAVTLGALHALMTEDGYSQARQALGLDGSSNILLINTEGDTDPDHYRQVMRE
ncbi:diaminopropionate ammonia-lyase [Salinicoccus siamensis]|uniref:Diaminopropionate ammonia-lyase n=1 Tax=Salinicoccus siamensis TaxID=381830 RepID=A0ABV5Z2B9_9STAP